MFKKLDFYLIRKFLGTFLFMVMILIVVTVVIDVTEKLDDFRNSKADLNAIVFDYFFNFIPFIANLLSPICVFLAVIIFTARLANDTEFVAMLSAGISLNRLFMPYLFVSILLSIGSFYLNAYWVPKATVKRMDFEYTFLKGKTVYGERDIHKKIAQNLYFYASSFNQYESTAYQFSLEKIIDSQLVSKLLATRAIYQDSIKKWKLENVKIRDFQIEQTQPNGFVPEKLTFYREIDTTILLSPSDIYKRENFTYSMTLNELNDYIELERMRNSDFLSELITNRMERYAYPFASIILTLIGFALSTAKKRGGIAVQLGIGIVLAFAYVVLVQIGKILSLGLLPAWLAVWSPNILFFLIGIFLLRIAPK